MKARLIAVGTAALVAAGASASFGAATPYPRPGRTELVSVGTDGRPAKYPPFTGGLSCGYSSDLTPDGRYVVFESKATNLVNEVSGQSGAFCQVFWRDRRTGQTRLVSVNSAGDPGVGGNSRQPSVSSEGRFVAFSSNAPNLMSGVDLNVCYRDIEGGGLPQYCDEVYVHDTRTGVTRLVSVSSTGARAFIGRSTDAAISGDGRYVAFVSEAPNLVPGDKNDLADVFRHDLATGRTIRLTVSPTGAEANGRSYVSTAISQNGRYVAFNSTAGNLLPGRAAPPGPTNVYLRDVATSSTRLVSAASDGTPASFEGMPGCALFRNPLLELPPLPLPPPPADFGLCYSYVGANGLSDDGRYVTFDSSATNLVPNDTTFNLADAPDSRNGEDIFVRDMKAGRTERVSVSSYGQQQPGFHQSPAISPDGRWVAFNTVPSLRSCTSEVLGLLTSCARAKVGFVSDRVTGAVDPAAPTPSGRRQVGRCSTPIGERLGTVPHAISAGGRWVGLLSSDTNLVPGDTNDNCDIFVRDRGFAVGVGRVGEVASAPPSGADQTCFVAPVCLPQTELGLARDAQLLNARAFARPNWRDVYLRLDLQRLAQVSGAPAGGVLYGFQFTASGDRYEVRVQRAPGPDYDAAGGASFGLFRESLPGVWTKVASLKGGYGTVGDAVVTAVPVSLLGGKAQLTDATAYTAVGSYASGPSAVLDSLRVAR